LTRTLCSRYSISKVVYGDGGDADGRTRRAEMDEMSINSETLQLQTVYQTQRSPICDASAGLRRPIERSLHRENPIFNLGEFDKNCRLVRASRATSSITNFGSALAGFIVEKSPANRLRVISKTHSQTARMRRSTFFLPSQLPAQRASNFAAVTRLKRASAE
jgi:hypothetical protein